jgi:hypothetical protein
VVPVAPTTSQTPTSPAAPTSPTISQSPNIPATTTPAPGSLLDRTIPDTTTEPAYDWVMLPPNTADPSITLIRLSYSSGRKILEKKSTTQVNHSSQIQTFSETTVKLTETRFVWDSTIEPLGGWKESICDVVTTRTIKLETIYKELNPGFFITDVGGDLLENSTIVEQKFFRSVNGNPLNMLFSNQSEIESMRYKDGRPRREINTMSVWRMNAHTLSYGHQKNYRYDGNSKLISKDETSFNGNINATFTKTDPDHDGVFTASHLKVIRDNQLLYDGPTEQCPLDVWVQLTGVLA